jgi:hypothetical protein
MSAGELNAKLGKRFPITREAGNGLVAFEFSRPEITIPVGSDRMVFAVDIAAKSPMLAVFTAHPFATRTTISGVPRYDPRTLSLYLGEVRLESFEGLARSEAKVLAPAVAMTGEIPIHTFRPDDFTRYGIRYEPQSLEVRDGRLLLRLTPPGGR